MMLNYFAKTTKNIKVTLVEIVIDLLIYWLWRLGCIISKICILPTFWFVCPCMEFGKQFMQTQGIWQKEKQPFLMLEIARYFWCMSLFANQFPQSQSAAAENRNHFPSSGGSWIYERCTAIYSLAWQREKWVCMSINSFTRLMELRM